MQTLTDTFRNLFRQWAGKDPESIKDLPPAGSKRKYFRVISGDTTAIGAWNPVIEENEAFFHFSEHFRRNGLHVPEIYAIDPGREIYLLEDLGDISLFSVVDKSTNQEITAGIKNLYRKSLSELVRFQVTGHQGLDYSLCYPRQAFDKRAILFDLNYFKYYFLRLHLDFHEDRLEDDFITFTDYLLKTDGNFFMYRDFQARNILIKNNQPYFIDYQGGRKGPLLYDVASLLFQVKADLTFSLRKELLEFYLEELSEMMVIDKTSLRKIYEGFVLIRLLQVLGAYGFRGLIEKKTHFIASIPYALKNLHWWIDQDSFELAIPELRRALAGLAALTQYRLPEISGSGKQSLTVEIKSFSYKNGYPVDLSKNGGGFVFDCRALPNPGREERYREFTGKDREIINYLKDEPAVIAFLDEAEKLVGQSVENYIERGFQNLSVSFGCTGGQHRSVYCAETLAGRLRLRFPAVGFPVTHTNLSD